MIFFAATPSSVLLATSSRSMSPVARWQTLYLSLIVGAWVPFPAKANHRCQFGLGFSGRVRSNEEKETHQLREGR